MKVRDSKVWLGSDEAGHKCMYVALLVDDGKTPRGLYLIFDAKQADRLNLNVHSACLTMRGVAHRATRFARLRLLALRYLTK